MADDPLILKAIRHGALAGGLRLYAAIDERLMRGFTRAAMLQSARSAQAIAAWLRANPNAEGGER